MTNLKEKILRKEATVAIFGLGYVGLPLLLLCRDKGFNVLGVDRDLRKITLLTEGKSYLEYIPDEVISKAPFRTTSDPDAIGDADIVIVCVPTPLGKHRDPDLSYVTGAAECISKQLRPGMLVVLESTTYPGTTEEDVLPLLLQSNLAVGHDFFLGYSPEREDPGNAQFSGGHIPRLVSGVTPACRELMEAFYGHLMEKVYPVSSTRVAEAAKILENTYRAVNIALVNELKVVFEKMGINIWEVVDAASTKPFGFQPFYPGPGLGGHCIPIDPFYLTWKAFEYESHTRLIELAGEINTSMPDYVVSRVAEALNTDRKSINGSRVLIVGVSYKKNVSDCRESPSLTLLENLTKLGAEVVYHDPHVPSLGVAEHHLEGYTSQPLNEELLKSADAALIVTDHDDIDFELVCKHSRTIVDTRNALKRRGLSATHVVLA